MKKKLKNLKRFMGDYNRLLKTSEIENWIYVI